MDQEVALDPELLGQVFENLLASYNPETGVKRPANRPVPSTRLAKSSITWWRRPWWQLLCSNYADPTDGDHEFWQERLRYLLDYAQGFR